jgi:ABC-2 type transport system ATP-binding protein
MPDPAVETHGLFKRFGPKLAVADLTLAISRGEIFGFLGPNGAGKTTSVKLLLSLLAPTGGTGRVLGAPIGDRETRRKIGFLPEHFRFHDCLTGRELLRFHGRLYGRRGPRLEARIGGLLDRMDLFDAADLPLHGYSKGMLQRVGLAQALINEPELIFLDEPTSGLDPLGRLLVRDLLRELRSGGTTVFLNSHMLGEVEATCDRVVFVKEGRTVHELALGDELGNLEVELRIAPISSAVLAGVTRFGRNIVHHDGIVRLQVDSETMLPSLARWLIQQDVLLYEMKSRRPSLEDVFLDVMGRDHRPG